MIRRLKVLGFVGPFPGKKHQHMKRDATLVLIPNPHGGEISVDLLSEILRKANISREEWFSAA
ncbi:MAG TPA: type II toxin-antitoxin system HicA family toxin [Methanotrichaceae archaeon]|nr:type II toxin-antitoxin system HicA family toxin [Methanotrichaceae archaeon]